MLTLTHTRVHSQRIAFFRMHICTLGKYTLIQVQIHTPTHTHTVESVAEACSLSGYLCRIFTQSTSVDCVFSEVFLVQLPVFIDMLDQEKTNVLKLCSATVVFEQLTTSPNGGGLQFFSIFSFYFIDFKRALLRPPKMRVVFSEGVT